MELGLVIPELEEHYQKAGFYQIIEKLQKGEIQAIEPHASFLLNKKEKKLLELKCELEKRNISISSVHAPFGEDKDLSSTSLITRRKAINQHLLTMKKMDTIKISVLTIHPGSRLKNKEESLSREKLFKKSLEILLKQAEKLKIKLAVENMLPMRTGENITTIKEIVDEFSSPYLGICFDTGHANVGKGACPVRNRPPKGDRTEMPPARFRKAGGKAIPISNGVIETFNIVKEKIFDFHIHDNDGTKDMHLQPPYGNINWAEFFAAIENINYQRPLMVESLPWQGRELSWMFKEVRMLKDNKILRKESPKTPNQSDVTSDGSGQEHYLKCAKCGHFIYGSESNPICYCNTTSVQTGKFEGQ